MLEVIALVAIMAILGAVVVPSIFSTTDSKAVTDTKALLDTLQNSINLFELRITEYPGRLSHLTGEFISTDASSCSNVTYGGDATRYQSQADAPYFFRPVSPTGGLPAPIGDIDDDIERIPNTGAGDLLLKIRGVRLVDAEALNDLEDGTAEVTNANGSNTLGDLRWPVPNPALGGVLDSVTYRVTRTGGNNC